MNLNAAWHDVYRAYHVATATLFPLYTSILPVYTHFFLLQLTLSSLQLALPSLQFTLLTSSTSATMNLPSDLHLHIIKHIDNPRDLLSLISACRTTFRLFQLRRSRIIARYQNCILNRLANDTLLPTVLLATHLRSLDKSTSTEREIRTLLDKYRRSQEAQLPSSLLVLGAIGNLLNDVDEVMTDYVRTAGMCLLPSHGRRAWPRARPSRMTPLCQERRKRLQMAILQYECYCHAFFRGETILMPANLDDRENLIAGRYPLSTFTVDDPAMSEFYSVLNYALNRHSNTFDKIVNDAGTKYMAPRFTQEAEEIYRLQHFFRVNRTPEMEKTRRLQEIRLRYRAPLKVHYYINWLCSQGLQTLLRLSHLDSPAQETFTLEAFSQVSRYQSLFALGQQRFLTERDMAPSGPWLYMHVFIEGGFSWNRPRFWAEGHHEGLFRYRLLS